MIDIQIVIIIIGIRTDMNFINANTYYVIMINCITIIIQLLQITFTAGTQK